MKGLLVRTFAKVNDLTWNMDTKSVDVTITSPRKQDITLIVRHGIESMTATGGALAAQPKRDADRCLIHLSEGVPVTLHLKIGNHSPSDWVLNVPPLH